MFHWAFRFGDIGIYAELAERALAQSQSDDAQNDTDRAAAARLRSGVSWVRFLVGDVAGALEVQESLDIDVVAVSDPACAALLLNSRAIALPLDDGGAKARPVAERCLELAESVRGSMR